MGFFLAVAALLVLILLGGGLGIWLLLRLAESGQRVSDAREGWLSNGADRLERKE